MDRWRVALFTCIALVAASLAVGSAAAQSPLAADAGDSRTTLGVDVTTLEVDGQVFGGQEPYNVTWRLDGSTDRFAEPRELSTTVNVSGLEGPIEPTLTVEDGASSTASDAVVYHVGERGAVLVDANVTVSPGAPDEFVGLSGVDGATREVPVQVPPGTDALLGVLTWQDGPPGLVVARNDLDLVLEDPDGDERNAGQGRTGEHPERVLVGDAEPGEWTARVEAFLTDREDARLRVIPIDSVEPPKAATPGPKLFGLEDPQEIDGVAKGGEDPVGLWDLDHDGVFEQQTETVDADLEVGTHAVRFRAEDARGLRVTRTIEVEVTDEAEHALPMLCGGRDTWDHKPMEFSASGGTCWMHGGHHTYALDGHPTVVGGEGFVFSVEQQFSPPTQNDGVTAPIVIETSKDGQAWEPVGQADYRLLEDPSDGVIGDELRQKIGFTFDAERPAVEFARVHQPRSSGEGLSGFLDNSKFFLLVNDTAQAAPAATTEQDTRTLTCEEGHVLEDFFEDHPCTFGGVNRYDAPSFFHTYAPGEGTQVTRVEASAEVLPWRTDDWFIPIVVTNNETRLEAYGDQVSRSTLSLQVSSDGQAWTTLATAEALYGEEQTFSVTLDEPVDAGFVRLIPGKHPSFEEYRTNAPLHHPDGFFVSSEVTLTGQLPAQ